MTITIAVILACGVGLFVIIRADQRSYNKRDAENREKTFQEILTREIGHWQVAIKGLSKFHAQIELTYKDGKLEGVELVPNTTTKVNTKQ